MRHLIIFLCVFQLQAILYSQTNVSFSSTELKNKIKTQLGISAANVTDADMLRLTTLNLSGSAVYNLNGLQYARNLKSFTYTNSYNFTKSDLNIIGTLVNLETLNIEKSVNYSTNTKYDFSFVNNLSKLTSLNAKGNKLDYNTFSSSNLTNLSTLNLLYTTMKAEDLSKFKSASKLQTFQVYHYFNNPESYSNRLCYDSIRGLCDALPLISYSDIVADEQKTYNVKRLVVGSRMTLNAYKIDTIAPRVYELSGDVSHFGVPSIRFYGTKVRVDMREELSNPIISGNGKIYYLTKIDENDNIIYGIFENNKIVAGEFAFYARVNPTYHSNYLTSSWSYKPVLNAIEPVQTDIEVYGFPIEIRSIEENPQQNLVTNVSYAFKELPFPFQYALDYAKENYNYGHMKGELLYKQTGNSFYSNAFNLNLSSLNMKAFSLQNISLTYNQAQDELAGSFSLSIPGEGFEAVAKQMNLSDNSKIIVVNNEDTIESTVAKVNNNTQGFVGSLQLGVIAEFRNGGIDKFVLSLGSKIPIGASGLFITEMTGGVEDFTSDSWKALANVDIETGIDLPIVGSPIKINDFGVKIAPMSEFEGSGSLEIFGSPTANATMAFNFEKGLFHVNSGVNIANILTGTMSATLQRANFKGAITGNIQTPETLPWGLGWAANTKISSVTADIDNAVIHTKGQVWKFTLAQKIEFGNPSFPYIYYSIGRNYDNLYSILKSPGYENPYSMMKSSSKPFDVPHGAQEIMLVAGTETELIDFSAKSPSGKIYTKSNSEYKNFPASRQSVMSLKDPEPGKWEVFTEYNGDFLFEAKVLNSAPVVFWEEHEDIVIDHPNLQTSYPKLNVNYLDYEDTLSIEVYLDADKNVGDGKLFYKFLNLTGSGSVEIPWNNAIMFYNAFGWAEYGKDYYFYCKVSDNKNEPTYMYAPFTFRKEHSENIYNKNDYPKNLKATISRDSAKLFWDNDPRSNTVVYYQIIGKTNISRIVKVDTSFCYIANLTPNVQYKAWAQFSFYDTINETTWHSPISDTLYFTLQDSSAISPLLFSEHHVQLEFIENTSNEYTFDISSRPNPSISFTYETDSKGIKMNQNILTWTPTSEDIGIHTVKIRATDSVFVNDSVLVDSILVDDAYVYMYADTMYLDTIMTDSLEISILVKSREQIASKVKFSAYYILENFVNIVEVYDRNNQNATEQIELYNTRTGEHKTINCHKSNGKYYGGFHINSAQANAISAAIGDTIWAEYNDMGGEIVKSYAVYARIPMNTSVKEQKVDSDMIISPNPTSNAIEIQLNTISNAKSIKIVNAQGNVVANIPINVEKIIHYSISDFVPGVYVVNVITADKTYSRKIIKI